MAGLLTPVHPVCNWWSPYWCEPWVSVSQGHTLATAPYHLPQTELAVKARLRVISGSIHGVLGKANHSYPFPGRDFSFLLQTQGLPGLSPRRNSTHYSDFEHVPTGPVMEEPSTHLRNITHGVVSILAQAVGTAPGGPGSANSLISLIGEQSSESGYKFSSRCFFGNSEGLWLIASF